MEMESYLQRVVTFTVFYNNNLENDFILGLEQSLLKSNLLFNE